MKRSLFILLGSILCLTGCSSGSSISSVNLACSSIEQYLDDKALALKSAADGGSAEEWIINTVGQLAQGIGPDPVSREIYDKYFDALVVWSQSVDRYVVIQNQEDLRNASGELEKAIDQLIPMCEKIGWKFQQGWR
jgi:hypothetical protein